jgi:HEAT repeat protein
LAGLKPDEEHNERSGARALKKKALALLTSDDWHGALEELLQLPGNQVVNPLISFLLHKDELVRWRAVIAIGAVVAALANENMERARVVMRRFMWSLNDESGGIGWGAPETMAEVMALNESLAKEYAPVFVSYLNPEGNYLEYEPLQRGLLWGLVRLAQGRPELVSGAAPFVEAYLDSGDSTVRGLASLAAGMLMVEGVRRKLAFLLEDDSELRVYADEGFQVIRVNDLAEKALKMLDLAPSQ